MAEMDYSDAETTREGLTNDGFSKEGFSKQPVSVTPGDVVTKAEISSKEVAALLDALPSAWNTGEELTGGSSIPWAPLYENSVYQYAEFIEGKYYPMLSFVVRLQGVQSGFITSDGEQFLESIKLPVEDLKKDASKLVAYLMKKEHLMTEMAKPARTDIDDIKEHVKVEYPSDMIGMRKFFGYRRDGTCSHAHLAGIKRFSHGEGQCDDGGEFKRKKVRCDNLHMRYVEKTDSWEVCQCLAREAGSDRTTPLSDSSPSVFQMVTGTAPASRSGTGSSASSAIDLDQTGEECLTCRCVRQNARSMNSSGGGGNMAPVKRESKENSDSNMNMTVF